MRQQVPLPRSDQDAAMVSTPVILFGAGIFARPALWALRQRGVAPVCFCDNSAEKQGKTLDGLPVLSPAEARERYPDGSMVISAAPQYVTEIRLQLLKWRWKRIHDCAAFLASFEYGRTDFESGVSALHFNLDRYFYEYILNFYPDRLIIPSLDIMITEKCSLRCRDCANLMQYYTQPLDLDFASLFESLDVFMKCVDHVLEFRVLGGETFMNRNAHKYIERLRQYPNFTRVAVYSNGTILPKGENLRCLIHEDVYLRITDYGPLSCRVGDMSEIFDACGIIYDIGRADRWQDCAGISKRPRTEPELAETYTNCCANKTLTLLKGHVYICPFAANGSNLGALPLIPEDTLSLENHVPREKVRKCLFHLLRNKAYFSACKYCSGRPFGATPLPAAVQIHQPLPYQKHCAGEV